MKAYLRLLATCGLPLVPMALAAQAVTGRVVDDKGQPLSYTNVVALSLPDSSFVTGVMTDDDGTFTLETPETGRLLRFSLVGYKTVYTDRRDDIGTVTLVPAEQVLGEVVVKSNLPKTRLKGEGMVTGVSGTILETAGTMEHLLDRIPNVSARNGKIEVFGRGEPEIYINGRKMRDAIELERLGSDNIKDIEVIANPGARYDASVTSVIRITTKKAVGEGFSVNNRLFGELNDYGYVVGQERLNLGWRSGGLDINGTLSLSRWANPDPKQIPLITYLDKTYNQLCEIDQVYKSRTLNGRLAVSYMFNENHSIGISARYDRRLSDNGGWMNSVFTQDGDTTETLRSEYTAPVQATNVQGNAYYVGKIGQWNIDFNTDWMWSKTSNMMNTSEDFRETGQAEEHNDVTTQTDGRNSLIASKLVVTAPLLGGNFSFGGEYSYSERKTVYTVLPKDIIDDDNSRIEEGMASAFIEYARQFGPVNMQVGLRYENVNFDYFEDNVYKDGQSKVYSNLFPSLALSAMFGKLNLQLGYAADIHRPSYSQLRSNITYDNRYTYEGGNPFLLPTKSHNVNFAASYEWAMFSAGYSHVIDPMLQHSETYKDDPAVALFRQVNGESYDKVYASFNLRPAFGIWHPSLMLGIQKQWFKMDVHGHSPLDNPLATIRFNNTLDTKICQISVNMDYRTAGADENVYIRKPSFGVDLSLYKAFFDKKLTVQLYADDLFKTRKNNLMMFYGTMRESYYMTPAMRNINLTVVYKFNVGRSKYKGTGAGDGQKRRF